MRTEGTLRNWNDDRGFGFVVTSETKQDVFVHVSSFPQTGRRPQIGERLAFSIETDHDGKKRAMAVSFLDPPSAAALAAMRNAPQATPASRHARRPRTDRSGSDRRAGSRGGAFGRLGGLAILLAAVGAVGAILQRDAIEAYLPWSAEPAPVSYAPNATVPNTIAPDAAAATITPPAAVPSSPAAIAAAPVASAMPAASSFSEPVATGFRCDGRTHCSQMTSCAEARYFLSNCPNVQMDGNHDGEPCEQQWCN